MIQIQSEEGVIVDESVPPTTPLPVIRENAENAKVRIVYNASAGADDQSKSLNKCLEPRANLQNLI